MIDRWRSAGRRARLAVVSGLVTVLVAGVGVGVMLNRGEPEPAVTPVATAEPEAVPTEEAEPAMPTVAMAAPQRVLIPSVGIDLAVQPDAPVNGVLDPPGVEDAYWIEDYGTPGTDADNTVYLAAHSSLRMDAAFNPLLDVEHQESVLEPGDEVIVETENGRLVYEVVRTHRYVKNELPDADEVWNVEPGVLHLITCFQEDGRRARATDNLVVTAELVGAATPEQA